MTTVFLTEQPLLSTECVKQLFNTVLFAALTESSLSTTETKQSKNAVDTRQRLLTKVVFWPSPTSSTTTL